MLSVRPAKGPAEGGSRVVILGRHLDTPTSVTIGGVEVQSVEAISDFRIEVIAPAHEASPVVDSVAIAEDVVVITTHGPGVAANAFTYVDDAGVEADVNRDGYVNAVDVQIVINWLLQLFTKAEEEGLHPDVNQDGSVDSVDVQVVVNEALKQ